MVVAILGHLVGIRCRPHVLHGGERGSTAGAARMMISKSDGSQTEGGGNNQKVKVSFISNPLGMHIYRIWNDADNNETSPMTKGDNLLKDIHLAISVTLVLWRPPFSTREDGLGYNHNRYQLANWSLEVVTVALQTAVLKIS